VLSGEATNTNVIVFGLTRPGLEPTNLPHSREEHVNHYTTDAVNISVIKTPQRYDMIDIYILKILD
jgi:hypothetical protein